MGLPAYFRDSRAGDTRPVDDILNNNAEYSRFVPPHLTEQAFIESRREKARQIAGILSRHVNPQTRPRVLDLGCHEGTITAALAATFPGITGADADAGAIAHARERFGATCEFHDADAGRLPFADASFDVVILNHVLYYLPDPAAAMMEVRRVLAPGGACYVAVINGAWLSSSSGPLARLWNRFVIRRVFRAVADCGSPVAYADYCGFFHGMARDDVMSALAERRTSYPLALGWSARVFLEVLRVLPKALRRKILHGLPSFIFILVNRIPDPVPA